jgi:hypothetical protein
VEIVDDANPYASPSSDPQSQMPRPAISGLRILIATLSALVFAAGLVHLWVYILRGNPPNGEGYFLLAIVIAASIVCLWSSRALQSRWLVVVSVSFLLLVVVWFFGSLLLLL